MNETLGKVTFIRNLWLKSWKWQHEGWNGFIRRGN